MVDLLKLEENKISTDFSGYPVVFMGETGDGKTDSINRYLRSVSPEGKAPLFLMFEDRYKSIKNIFAIRIYSIPDIVSVISQLKNPKVREKYSGVVIDTADKFEDMANRYIASSKEVEITEEIGYGKGKRYLNAAVGLVSEIRNLGLPVHFNTQVYKKTDINTKAVTMQCKLNDVTKSQMFHDAFLVGLVTIDNKAKDPIHSDRLITFRKTSVNIELKDSFGLPDTMHILDIKSNLEKVFNANYAPNELRSDNVMEEIPEVTNFKEVIERGQFLGSLLAENGYLEDAMNVLKTNIGQNEDGSPKMFDNLIESQADLANMIVLKFEELIKKYKIQGK